MIEALKPLLLEHCYAAESVTPLPGYRYLAAKHNTTNVGIFVLPGVFTRDVFKAAVAEAKAAELKTPRMYVYADLCAYYGPGIEFTKLDELRLPAISEIEEERTMTQTEREFYAKLGQLPADKLTQAQQAADEMLLQQAAHLGAVEFCRTAEELGLNIVDVGIADRRHKEIHYRIAA